jgi:murein DD-endopeptidase MepM/ murein hydrolase activator NlpD
VTAFGGVFRAPYGVGSFVSGLLLAASSVRALSIEVLPPQPKQGEIVVVTLRSPAPLSSATLSDGTREIAMEAASGGRMYRALLGIDLESKVGKRKIEIVAADASGASRTSAKTIHVRSGKFPTQKLKVAPAYVEPPESELARIAADREKVRSVYAEPDSERRFEKAFRRPLPSASPSSSRFGVRRVFNDQPRSPHDGVDLAAPEGEPVVAAAPAIVALAEELYFSGNTVILDHGAGLFTTYLHLSAIDVRPGDAVAAGQRIGAVGATGRATGPHLHWGARLHKARVNPLDLLQLPAWPAEPLPKP